MTEEMQVAVKCPVCRIASVMVLEATTEGGRQSSSAKKACETCGTLLEVKATAPVRP